MGPKFVSTLPKSNVILACDLSRRAKKEYRKNEEQEEEEEERKYERNV